MNFKTVFVALALIAGLGMTAINGAKADQTHHSAAWYRKHRVHHSAAWYRRHRAHHSAAWYRTHH